MIQALVSLLIGFGVTDVHVTDCHRGDWCRGNALTVMPSNPNPYQRVTFKAWPPYFDPIIVTPLRGVTKQYMVNMQYGIARRNAL